VTVRRTPNDLRMRVADMQAQIGALLVREGSVRNKDLQPSSPLDDGSEQDADNSLPVIPSQDDAGCDRGFPDILQKLVLYTGAHGNVVLDFDLRTSSPIVNGTPMSNRFMIESPTYHQSIKARMAVLEAAAPVHIQSIGTQCNLVIRTPTQAAKLKEYIRSHLSYTRSYLFVDIFTNLVWDAFVFVLYHIVLAIPSYFIGVMMSDKHDSIREAVIVPSKAYEYFTTHPVQMIKPCVVVGTVGLFLVFLPVWDVLRRLDSERRTQFYTALVVVGYMYVGAVESADTVLGQKF
jgi:hypothetical protein